MNDLISIVVPVYKVEDYLQRCVDSILRQTYKNIELVLVDDGSPDNCGKICDEYAAIDSRIRVIHKENGGLSDARNTGIDIAKGKYITFIDSDDWVADHYIEKLYDLIISRKADLSICNYIKTDVEDIEFQNDSQSKIYEFTNVQALDKLCGELYEELTVSWGKLYKTELFKDVRFPVGKIHEDEFTTYKILYKANKIVFTTEKLLYYWQRPDSIMGSRFNIVNRLHVIEAFEERAKFFEYIGMANLKDKTYWSLFCIYRSVNDNIHMFDNNKYYMDKYNDGFHKFKLKLRNSNQPLRYKLFYETYLLYPNLANKFELATRNIRALVKTIK